MTSSMLAPANITASSCADSSAPNTVALGAPSTVAAVPESVHRGCSSSKQASASQSSSAVAVAAAVIEAETAAAAAATNLVAKAASGVANTTTNSHECTGLVSSQDFRSSTVHPQPPFRSHVLLSNNSELSLSGSVLTGSAAANLPHSQQNHIQHSQHQNQHQHQALGAAGIISAVGIAGAQQQNLQASSMTMQQAAATDYFRPYLHTTPYSPGGGAAVPSPTGHMTPMAAHPHFPYHPTAHHPRILSHDRDSQAALAAAAAVNAAAAAAAANNNSPTYKGYQNFYSNNNQTVDTLEATVRGVNNNNPTPPSSVSGAAPGGGSNNIPGAGSGQSSDNPSQQYSSPAAGNRIFPARPQPTRPVMPTIASAATGASPPSGQAPIKDEPAIKYEPAIKDEPALTPPPSVMTHHRSQQIKSSPAGGVAGSTSAHPTANNSATNNNSAASYRDKLGLNSPSNHSSSTTPPTTTTPMSPASVASHSTTENGGVSTANSNSAANSNRRPSGNNNSKFRYPSGPSSSSSPPPPATPSSAMSSREGTPLPASQRPEDAAPNVDISRVQIAENNDKVIKREHPSSDSIAGMQSAAAIPGATTTTTAQHQQQQQFGYQFGSPHSTSGLTPPTTSPPSTFSAQYSSYLAQQQQQQHQQQQPPHHMGWPQQQQHYYPLDGANNNLMVRGLQDAASLRGSPAAHHLGAPGAMGGYGNAYDPHHQYQYPGTIHHYGDPTSAQHSSLSSVVAAAAAAASSSAGASVAGVSGPSGSLTGVTGGRGRGHHHSGSGSVKIGRRPAHLPKVLKFNDKSLPPGWVRKLKCRKHGKQAGRWDVYIYSPCGVKFASKKKLKAFFEKNNLNYDIEEFDFTPYGRHTDSGAGRPSGSSGSSASVRHNSSGSTGSEGTHAGSSPASLHNYSPTHHHALQSSSSTYMPQSMIPGGAAGAASRLYSAALGPTTSGPEFSSFTAFDPLMENPPNASVQDVPPPPAGAAAVVAATSTATCSSTASTDFMTTSLAVVTSGGNTTYKHGGDTSEFFPAEMAEILGSNPAGGIASLSAASNGLTGSAFGPPLSSLMATSDSYSDLTQTSSLHHHAAAVGSLQPLSNASMESRGSTEDDTDEASVSGRTGDNKVSVFSKAIRSLNDFGSVYSFD